MRLFYVEPKSNATFGLYELDFSNMQRLRDAAALQRDDKGYCLKPGRHEPYGFQAWQSALSALCSMLYSSIDESHNVVIRMTTDQEFVVGRYSNGKYLFLTPEKSLNWEWEKGYLYTDFGKAVNDILNFGKLKTTCPECGGSGVYTGLNVREPCRACS